MGLFKETMCQNGPSGKDKKNKTVQSSSTCKTITVHKKLCLLTTAQHSDVSLSVWSPNGNDAVKQVFPKRDKNREPHLIDFPQTLCLFE